jgi:exosortase A-associated hydrolase 1
MMRRHFTFSCEGSRLVGTLDEGDQPTGLLLVSGGNEVRSGAWNGQALLAARIAAEGYPVMRFDRRGIGDSEGVNREFRSSGPDITAALAAFRQQCPQITRMVGFGNCDAASALMLTGGAGLDALVLSNPWTFDVGEEAASPEVVRDHYRRRLSNPAAIRRLLTGEVSFGNVARSLVAALRPAPAGSDGLAAEMAQAMSDFQGSVRFLIAGRDRTGLAFRAKWQEADARMQTCPDATHSYVEPEAQEWLLREILVVLNA